MKARIVISECVGPLWLRKGTSKSMSGMIEAVSNRGMFSWACDFVADVFAAR